MNNSKVTETRPRRLLEDGLARHAVATQTPSLIPLAPSVERAIQVSDE
jgi:hypothetical protein